MAVFNYEIKIHLIRDAQLEDNIPLTNSWYPALANIYGIVTKNFDGYITSVRKDGLILTILCYLIEGPEEEFKLADLKKRNISWADYRSVCIMDAVNLHSRALSYVVDRTEIKRLIPEERSSA